MLLFMKFKWVSILFSIALLSFMCLYTYTQYGSFNKGLDFSGGVKIIYLFKNFEVKVDHLRNVLPPELSVQVNEISEDGNILYYFELPTSSITLLNEKVEKDKKVLTSYNLSQSYSGWIKYYLLKELSLLKKSDSIEEVSLSFVGPTVGKNLLSSSLRLLGITLILITVYIAFRFHFSYAVGALIALLHDLLIVAGFIGILQISLSIPVVAAILTIMGYSINDTIVIFDRIRENHQRLENISIVPLIDRSINESLSRTIITSLTSLLAVSAIYFFSGETLQPMSLVLIIGIIVGTYSSTFIASPILIFWDRFVKKF